MCLHEFVRMIDASFLLCNKSLLELCKLGCETCITLFFAKHFLKFYYIINIVI